MNMWRGVTYIKYALTTLCVLLIAGCWSSDHQLIESKSMADPFGHSQFYRTNLSNEQGVLQKLPSGEFAWYDTKKSGGHSARYRFQRFTDIFFLGSQKKYIVSQETPPSSNGKATHSYMYALMTRDEAGYFRVYQGNESRQFTTLKELKNAFRQEIRSGSLDGVDFGNVTPISKREADAWLQAEVQKAEARERKKKEEAVRAARAAAEKAKQDRIKRSRDLARQARKASDREPSQSEMQVAINNTVAGQVFNPKITKLGACSKVAPNDYMCRYRWVGVNMGNFWKHNGAWHFRRVDY